MSFRKNSVFLEKFSNNQETIFKKLEKIKVSFQEFTIYTFFMNSKCFECYLENYAFFRKLFLIFQIFFQEFTI